MATRILGGNGIDQELGALRDDLAALRGDLASLASAVGGAATVGGKEAYDRLKEQAIGAAETVAHEVERRPIISLAVAFGLGFLLGKLLERR